MNWLVLLVLAGLAMASDFQLGDRIVATEQECDRILKLNKNWSTRNFHEQAAQYVDLYFICVESLNEDKYAYIDKNQVVISWDADKNDKFPVDTSEGKKFVTKPLPRKPKDEESMKKKLSEYLIKTGGMINPVYRLMSVQSEMGQEIVNKQVQCEAVALYVIKHPDEKESEHNDCINELNCMKEKFMKQHMFTRNRFPDFFPILYKRRGTMIKTPPAFEKSVCESPDSPEGSKKELEKWMSGIEYIGEKLTDFGEAGTDFIQKLVKKGMGGGDKVLTKKDLDELMNDAESVSITDDDGEDDDDDENTHKVYGDVMMDKLAELEAKGIKVAHAQLDKAKPAIGKVQNIASLTGEKLKTLEEVKLKPVIEKTANGIAGLNIKEKSKSVYEGVKDGLTVAGSVAKTVSSKAKGEGSLLINKLKSKSQTNTNVEDDTDITEEHEQGHEDAAKTPQESPVAMIDRMIQPQYLPNHYDDTQAPSLLGLLKDMSRLDKDEKDDMSYDELKKTLKSLKESTRKRAEELNLTEDNIKQSADVVKGIMHSLLSAASHGHGSAKDMTQQEIEKAKSLVNDLVNYATTEALNIGEKTSEEEDDEDSASDEGDAEDKQLESNSERSDSETPKQKTTITASDKATTQEGQDTNSTPKLNEDSNQTTPGTQEEEECNVEDKPKNIENKDVMITNKKQDVPDLK